MYSHKHAQRQQPARIRSVNRALQDQIHELEIELEEARERHAG